MTDTYDLVALTAELTEDEGRRLQAYTDTVGLTTIGIGRELSRKGISDAECDLLFRNDVAACEKVLDFNLPWWRRLPQGAQRVMINLAFMGIGSFLTFRHFLAHMQTLADGFSQTELDGAIAELMNSRWWQQVGTRGPRVVARLRAAWVES